MKTAFPSAEEGRPVSVRREKLKGRNAPAARKRTKAALVLNKAKESRQAAITAKRRKVIETAVRYICIVVICCLRQRHCAQTTEDGDVLFFI